MKPKNEPWPEDLVGVSPMKGPSETIFELRRKYDPEYVEKCKRCTTNIKFKHSEAQHMPDPQGDWVVVRCPVCSNGVTADSKI